MHAGLRALAGVLAATLMAALVMALGVQWAFESLVLRGLKFSSVVAIGLPPTVTGSALLGIAFVALGVLVGRWLARRRLP